MPSILDQFRTTPATAPRPVAPSTNREPYVALHASPNPLRRLDIRCALHTGDGLSHLVPYHGIHSVMYDRRGYTAIYMAASGLFITITGRNLKPIVEALQAESAHFIQQFDDALFASPAANDPAPFIDGIHVDVMTKDSREKLLDPQGEHAEKPARK